MKKLAILILAVSGLAQAQQFRQDFVDRDIVNFWKAYDKITAERDTLKQERLLHEYYIDIATPGLKSLMLVRRYSSSDYLKAIRNYPKFWQSVRENTLSAKNHYPAIQADVQKLQQLYPALKHAPIYFSIGVFRTGGTTHEGKVLIGAEASLADKTAAIGELPDWRKPFYKNNSPVSGLPLLCAHEYIHTQQKPLVENLLSKCLYEGVAEFISCLATGKTSDTPAIAFGKTNSQKVISRFVDDMYKMTFDGNWIWGENTNELKVRDLGYYVGYEICERYYNKASDKRKAVAELIELDYTNESAVERIVDQSELFPKSIADLYAEYEAKRPTVLNITPFENGDLSVRPASTKITVHFSEPLNGQSTSIDFGPLGQEAFPTLVGARIWSPDAKSWTIEADLKPNKKYQILISNNFRTPDGTRLKPYLIEFKTAP